MSILILLAAALLPAILLWVYIVRQDPQPEPTSWLAKAVLYGVGICIPVAMFEMLIERVLLGGEPSTLIGTTIQAFFVAALPEESFKPKMHKFAKAKIVAQIEKDYYNDIFESTKI